MGQLYKLGKQAPRPIGNKDLLLAKYLRKTDFTHPARCSWSDAVKTWSMYLNDQLGDCAIAGPGHMVKAWTANAGAEQDITDKQILKAYEDVGHYDPSKTKSNGENPTDGGCVLSDVLDYWATTGIGGHKIAGHARVSLTNLDEIKFANYVFGGLLVGVALPKAAQDLAVWDVPSVWKRKSKAWLPGSWGGHCICFEDYDADSFECITWGDKKKLTNEFLLHYCDEIHAVISVDWLKADKVAPNGLDLAALQKDLLALRS